MHAKNQDGSPRKILRWRQFFPAGFISVSRDFTPYFHFRCAARATFDGNLIHSADACFLVMTCVGYSRTHLECEQSLFGQSRLSSAGLERANSRERGTGERREEEGLHSLL